jgi:PadR family transcriptional regulator PadR
MYFPRRKSERLTMPTRVTPTLRTRLSRIFSGPAKQCMQKKFDKMNYYASKQYKDSQYNGIIDRGGRITMGLTDLNYWKSLINIGLTKLLVLKVLSKGPNHGYGVLKALEAMTSGCCVPTFGTIYPILKELSQNGYATIHEDQQLKGARKRRVYTLTPSGIEAYKVALEAWQSTIPYIYKALENDQLVFMEDMKMRLSKK